MNWLWIICTRRIKGRNGYIQRCVGHEVHKMKDRTVKVRKVFWAAEATEDETAASLRRAVNRARATSKFRPKHFMAIEPVIESIRVPFWSKAFWTGNTKDVSFKIRMRIERKTNEQVGLSRKQ